MAWLVLHAYDYISARIALTSGDHAAADWMEALEKLDFPFK